ncbi:MULTISPECIES: hypothetical protein [Methylobacterium]|uniref:Integrase n=4 Tax=Pseudomonadota TaxID=1224 RepID=A0ABQ4T1D3_9HYPH|nr:MULTISPECIES: hypothetical protein [Methylobacterium]PIU08166.1 MAG: hypothetical protein COT56_02260 [Methylobacterium sp. CG09_land_8_20_14_0_10_71_15]PIU15676.1 MAG: hypothetical protein COT28_03510 [Methylobacterium sp. CG08_land_8_20_14_0_20_71_15]GBU17266.1 hypothetical protein AwMethylo_14810 [Methylobacterium sp.]GJE07824.1 hypothetical protein AOPFMNJM_3156 [Methylobacterium jeotgali]
MGNVKIPYYTVRDRHGHRLGYWAPTAKMRGEGFKLVACGADGPAAWALAKVWNDRWQAHRRGQAPAAKRVYPVGSLGEAFERYKRTETWDRKKPRTREDWNRGWRYIEPIFGDVAPCTIPFDVLDEWYADLLESAGVREAHRAMKIWRALWVVAAAMSTGRPFYCSRDADPSLGIRRTSPQRRQQAWQGHELRPIIQEAWRQGYRGLACLVSIMWDTAFAPVDARQLTLGDFIDAGRWGAFKVARAKTGMAALGTLSRRSNALMRAYLGWPHVQQIRNMPLFRTREGAAYRKNSLAEDFRTVRALVDPLERRQMLDIRRSVALEARAGGASTEHLGAKLANTISTNAELERTYQPVDLAAVQAVDQARIVARRQARANKGRRKV